MSISMPRIFGGDCHQQPDSGGRRRRAGRIFRVPERGSSKSPIELLRLAGVDMAGKEPVEDALEVFEEYAGKLEKILAGGQREI